MDQVPYDLDDNRREIVLEALQERCRERGWNLLAAHVRLLYTHSPDRCSGGSPGKQEDVRAAIRYVIDQQGPPMAVFEPVEPGHV
jgi:hypothetical protein